MSIASQLYRQQIAQRSRDVSHGSVLSGMESERAIEAGQAGRALAKYSKSADLGQKAGKWGGQALGSTILRGLMLANPVTAPFALFAPAIGTMMGQGAATVFSNKGAKDLAEKYGSGYLGKTFKDMGREQLKSGLLRAGLSGIQSGLMAKFAPDMTAEGIGKKGIEKQLKGLGGKDPGIFKSMIEKYAPDSAPGKWGLGTKDSPFKWAMPEGGLSTEEIQAILAGEAGKIGAGTSIMQGIYDLGFGSPTFSWDEIGGE